MKDILVIDDEIKLRGLLARIIRSEGFDVTEAADLKSALKKLEQQPVDVVLCDVKLPDGNGVDFTKTVKSKFPGIEIILLTAYGNIADGVQAIKNGAFDYIIKGDDNEKIIPLLHRAIEKVEFQNRIRNLEKRIGEKFSFSGIAGQSKKIVQAVSLAQKVAPTDTAVLITGETGTGKEVFAQAIHQVGKRSGKNFVALNCSTFSKDILESELFGYKQGAFTGAHKDKKGLLEEANGGTLFLDEIGEMPLELQAKLLRVLETHDFIKLGDTQVTKSNFRLIAATNRDLKRETEQHRFRPDLYYRLNVFNIELPPLRDRIKDIRVLAGIFIEQYSLKMNKTIKTATDAYLQALEAYDWPGNIRELKNIIERSVILEESDQLTIESLPLEIRQIQAPAGNNTLSAFSLDSAEKLHIQKVMNYTGGNKSEAARLLNIAVTTLYRKLEEYKIS